LVSHHVFELSFWQFITKEGLSKPSNMFGSQQRRYIMSHMFENELPRGPYQLEFGGQTSEQEQQPKKRSYRCITQEQIEELDA
jgi:hypothetical protein